MLKGDMLLRRLIDREDYFSYLDALGEISDKLILWQQERPFIMETIEENGYTVTRFLRYKTDSEIAADLAERDAETTET